MKIVLAAIMFVASVQLSLVVTTAESNYLVCIEKNSSMTSCDARCSKKYEVDVGILRNKTIKIYDALGANIKFCSPTIFLEDVQFLFGNIKNLVINSALKQTTLIGANTGFRLTNISNVEITSLQFHECGMLFKYANYTKVMFTAMLIEDSSNVTIKNVSFIDSIGSGLIMLSISGDSVISECSFENSTTANVVHNGKLLHTRGLHIELPLCEKERLRSILNSSLLLSSCKFTENKGIGNTPINNGGGLLLRLCGQSAENKITIEECQFYGNSATRGGGVKIILRHRVQNNSILLINTKFTSNQGIAVGGGVSAGYFFNQYKPLHNKIEFSRCNFHENKAPKAGGISVYSGTSSDKSVSSNFIQFTDCVWENNSAASIGAAISVNPLTDNHFEQEKVKLTLHHEWYVSIVFKNPQFLFNYFHSDSKSLNVRNGILFVSKIPVLFEGYTRFKNNNGTALSVFSSVVNTESGSQFLFSNNNASANGGALNLIGLSIIQVKDNISFTFSNNTACAGAGIQHHSKDPNDFVYSTSCFIQYNGNTTDVQERNINFIFKDNVATCEGFGRSIHLTTVLPCNFSHSGQDCSPYFEKSSLSNCVANFTFLGEDASHPEVSTDAREILVDNEHLTAIPGATTDLPIHVEDELGNEIPGVYYISIKNESKVGSIWLDPNNSYTTSSKCKVFGNFGARATLRIRLQSATRNFIEKKLMVTLDQCNPGYVLVEGICTCSSYAMKSLRYQCITECHQDSALVEKNWWINYVNKNAHRLIYGYCPKDHCINQVNERKLKVLNGSMQMKKLDTEYICHPTRKGKLCSQCKENYTVHYHSDSYACGSKRTCKWGWFLYVLSELLPTTLLFVTVIVFDIKLTSGIINGLIYFAQTINAILLNESNYFSTSKTIQILMDGYSLFVRIFNLNFFQIEGMSFCLWESAQTLDMIAFQYITNFFSLLLLVLIVVAVHCCNTAWFEGVRSKLQSRRQTARSALIHGITGFLILSYSQLISTSMNLLLSVSVYSKGHKEVCRAVYYNGEFIEFSGQHLYYAIPAIFILSTFGVIPPLLLIVYPLCYKILDKIKLNETKFSQVLCKLVPLEKMKPLFDSFQCSFKDKYRFFGGLYFAYRLSTLAIQAVVPATGSTTTFYTVISMQSACIFAIHALYRPFKNKLHNILEGLFLFDITAIAISFTAVNIHDSHSRNTKLVIFQLFLLYLPIMIVAVYAGRVIWHKIKELKYFTRRKTTDDAKYFEFNDSIALFQESENRSSLS